jgi:hypothetical protein
MFDCAVTASDETDESVGGGSRDEGHRSGDHCELDDVPRDRGGTE